MLGMKMEEMLGVEMEMLVVEKKGEYAVRRGEEGEGGKTVG